MILTLEGLSAGVLGDMKERSRGTGADILIRPPHSNVFSLSGNMKLGEKKVALVRQRPHVAVATGTLVQPTGTAFDNITGIHLDEFNQMSGGFHPSEGGPFQRTDDLMVDEDYARAKNLHVGSAVNLGHIWHVCAIVESGKMSQKLAQIEPLREMYGEPGEVSVIYVKVDHPANIESVKADLNATLNPGQEDSDQDGYKVYTMQEFLGLVSVNNYPLFNDFTKV